MKAEMSGQPEKLVGKYFHSANETNQIYPDADAMTGSKRSRHQITETRQAA